MKYMQVVGHVFSVPISYHACLRFYFEKLLLGTQTSLEFVMSLIWFPTD